MHKKRITYILLVIGLLSILGGNWGTNFSTQPPSSIPGFVPTSADVENSSITFTNEVERMVDLFTVTVDLSVDHPTADFVEMTIFYNNGTDINYTLSGSLDIWTYSMYFEAYIPIGDDHTFQIFVYESLALLGSSEEQTFEIKNSPPRFGIQISDSIIYREETIFFNVTPTDPEDNFGDLSWSWEILYHTDSMNSSSTRQITALSHSFPASTPDIELGSYAIKGIVSDLDGGSTTNVVNFTLMNNSPEISTYVVSYPGTGDQMLRDTEHLNLKVNVTDIEDPDDVDLRVMLYGPSNTIVTRTGRMVKTNPLWDFDGNISLPLNVPIGEYTCVLTAHENITVESNPIEYNNSESFEFELLNNIPDADNITFTINNQVPSGLGIRIKEFEPITFNISISDVDIENIDIIQIQLLPPTEDEILFSFDHDGSENLIYTIKAKDMEHGDWIAWIWVIDSDGERIQSAVAFSFNIVPDRFPKVLPWIMLVIGAGIAFGVSMAFLGTRYVKLQRDFDNLLSRSGDYKKTDGKSKKSPSESKKISSETKKEKESPSSTKSNKKSSPKKHKLFREIKKK